MSKRDLAGEFHRRATTAVRYEHAPGRSRYRPTWDGVALNDAPRSWETRDELHFVAAAIAGKLRSDALDWLLSYRRAAEVRAEWDRVNPAAVLRFVDREIESRSGRPA